MIPSTDLSWGKLVLGGVVLPGVCKITRFPRVDDWDIQRANGKKGATTKLKGSGPVEFTATFELVDDPLLNELEEWEEAQALIESTTSGATPKALPVYHPSLALLKVGPVCKKEVGSLEALGGGKFSISCSFVEYAPPKPSSTKSPVPSSASGAGYKGGGSDALSQATAQLDKLIAEGSKT